MSKHFVKRIMLTMVSFFMVACASTQESGNQSSLPAWTDPNPFINSANYSFESPESKGLGKLGFLFSAHTMGEIDVCGCALNPKGGLDRRLNYVRKLRLSNDIPILFFDAGNTLFPTEKIQKSQVNKLQSRADLILSSYSKMLIQGMNVGALDLSLGVEKLKELAKKNKVPLLSSNIVDQNGAYVFETEIRQKIGVTEILVLGFSSGSESFANHGLKTLEPMKILKEKLSKVDPTSVVVVLSDLGQPQDEILAKEMNRPLIVVGSRETFSLELPLHIGKSLVMRPHFQGQQWSFLEFDWKKSSQGWYNFFMAQSFQILWDSRAKSYKEISASGKNGESEKSELAIIENSRNELKDYLPGNLKSKVFYRYTNTSLTENYSKPNELTPLIRKLK